MSHTYLQLDAVNALLTEPSTALGVEADPEVAILCIQNRSGSWAIELEALVSGCIVLGFKKVVLDLGEARIATPFQTACVISAWHLLIEVGGTLLLCGVEHGYEGLVGDTERRLFNLLPNKDEAVDWLASVFVKELEQNFPRTARCMTCGTESRVSKRGDHVCDACGMTCLVTERGELLF